MRTGVVAVGDSGPAAPVVRASRNWSSPPAPGAAVMHAAPNLADDVAACALIVPTATGGTARMREPPPRPIVALAHDPAVAGA